ncbi:oxygenase MpaB family protein [Nocardia sp. NPDC050697]|uniref:oxygenase MpaB family protein n=1 Tax=Nocardia sp. NPDC050697 TaxID=3155158 RepID=UPI0033F28559
MLAEFRKHTGSVLSGVFGGAAFDQVALVPVAAAVDRTGRFAENFADRGVRSGFSALLSIWADPVDRQAEAEWLKERHRDVRGRGQGEYAGVRYSALNPQTWIWVGVSGMFLSLNTFTPCTGHVLRPEEKEAAYQFVREGFRGLELASRAGKLPPDLASAEQYYEHMVEHELAASPFLVQQYAGLKKLPLPTLGISPAARAVLTPLWLLVRPLVGHVIQVCSAQVMHPEVRRMVGFELLPRHDREFALYRWVLRTAWRLLPDRSKLVPLAHNRLQYEKLVAVHKRYALDSFAPPERSGGCPV